MGLSKELLAQLFQSYSSMIATSGSYTANVTMVDNNTCKLTPLNGIGQTSNMTIDMFLNDFINNGTHSLILPSTSDMNCLTGYIRNRPRCNSYGGKRRNTRKHKKL